MFSYYINMGSGHQMLALQICCKDSWKHLTVDFKFKIRIQSNNKCLGEHQRTKSRFLEYFYFSTIGSFAAIDGVRTHTHPVGRVAVQRSNHNRSAL